MAGLAEERAAAWQCPTLTDILSRMTSRASMHRRIERDRRIVPDFASDHSHPTATRSGRALDLGRSSIKFFQSWTPRYGSQRFSEEFHVLLGWSTSRRHEAWSAWVRWEGTICGPGKAAISAFQEPRRSFDQLGITLKGDEKACIAKVLSTGDESFVLAGARRSS